VISSNPAIPVRAFFNSGKTCEEADFARLDLRPWAEIVDLTKWIYSVMVTGQCRTRAYYPRNLDG